MVGIVVDTDVLSMIFRGDSRHVLYLPHLQNKRAVVSFQTVAELYLWARSRNWGSRRRALLDRDLTHFTIQYADDPLCSLWAQVRDSSSRIGHTIGVADAWQAATALYHDVPLLTHNRRDFARVPGLTVISHAP